MEFRRKSALLLASIIFLFSPYLVGEEQVKICLTMIVKNEGKIIERCLNNAKDIVDFISICDTGSDDDTVQIIEKFIKESGIPGKVHRHQWKNFGYNRTLSAEAAQKSLKEAGFPLDKTYLLLIDADMVLRIDPSFKKNSLHDDAYLIAQNHGQDYSWFNMRLIRASLPWHCVGPTHEYWSCKAPCKESNLTSLSIDDRGDGGCKADKFERDVRLLTQGLKEEPENVRYMFYLAQSYKCLNNYDEAIKWYKERIRMGGWMEEVWYSKYMIGQCYEAKGDWDQALTAYLDAFQYNPSRAESLQQISTHYRYSGQNELAYLFAKQGSSVPFPKEDRLFISNSVYDYLFDQDISIAAYYTSHREEGFDATNRLMLKKNIPYYVKEQAYRNVLFYVQNLKGMEYQPIAITLPPVREGLAATYNPTNPSIRKTDKGYEVICRTVNYTQVGARYYKTMDLSDPTNTIKTKNFLVQYDRDLKLLSQKEIVENLPRKREKVRPIEGLEDCRIFGFKGSSWFTCTTLDTNPAAPQISLCKLSNDRSKASVQVEKLTPLIGPNPSRCEKNWLPFVKDNELLVIYSCEPFTVYKPDIERGTCQLQHSSSKTQYDFSRFSGSAPPVEFDDGYLFLVHETLYDNDQRKYLHRFVKLDNQYNITQISKPFIFMHQGIEYCCGMALDHTKKKLIMGIGIEDREAYLATIDLTQLRPLLEPLP